MIYYIDFVLSQISLEPEKHFDIKSGEKKETPSENDVNMSAVQHFNLKWFKG